jgi:class 3 adenylate cyclase/CHASE2 domain-containing sensor protein
VAERRAAPSAPRSTGTLPHLAICLIVGALLVAASDADRLRAGLEKLERSFTGRDTFSGAAPVRGLAHAANRLMQGLESQFYDRRLELRVKYNPGLVDPRLLVVSIDDRSLARYGRWPWPRPLQARLIEGLAQHGARGALLDIEYPEASGPGREDHDAALANALKRFAAFGMMFTQEAPQTLAQKRRQVQESRILEWVMGGGVSETGALPKDIRAAWADDPDLSKRAEDVLALSRYLMKKPAADLMSLVADQVLPDLALPAALPDVPSTHPVLIVPAALSIVHQNPKAPAAVLEQEIARATELAGAAQIPAVADRVHRFLETLVSTLTAKIARIDEVGLLLKSLHDQLLERYVLAEMARGGARSTEDAVAAVQKRHGLPASGLTNKMTRMTELRRSLALLQRRDLEQIHGEPLALTPRGELTPPIPPVARAYTGVGMSVVQRDHDGTLRRQPLFYEVEETYPGGKGGAGDPPGRRTVALHATLRPAALLMDLDLSRIVIEPPLALIPRRDGAGGAAIPIDHAGNTLLDLRGRWMADGFPHVNAVQVLDVVDLQHQREIVMREQPDYLQIARLPEALEAWPQLPVAAPSALGTLAAAVLPGLDAMRSGLIADLHARRIELRRKKLYEIGMEVKAYVQAMDDARQQNDQQTLTEAAQALEPIRRIYDDYLVRLPLMEENLRRLVKDRMCLVGATATSTTDISVVPLEARYINLGVHVNLMNQILRGSQLRPSSWAWLDLPILLAYLVLLPLVLTAFSIRGGALLVAATVGGHLALASGLMVWHGLVMDVGVPVLSVVTSYVLITLRRYLLEERQKQQIREMFETYLDPKVVEMMVDDETLWHELGGSVREITPFFSDLAGFASMAELLTPEELSDMLVDYLTPMTEILLHHGGVRERYVGDAIVAFFGAPVIFPDHATKACLSAIEQIETLERLRREWWANRVGWYVKLRQNGHDLAFRIGIATGPAKVGNFGSKQVKNYSMNGDIVNLAARLEGTNKTYGTQALCSEATFRAASDTIEMREVDMVRVVGKNEAVKIYQLMGRAGIITPETKQLKTRFEQAVVAYRARRFDEARSMFAAIDRDFPGDGPTRAYMARLEDAAYLATLGPDWDGSYAATAK